MKYRRIADKFEPKMIKSYYEDLNTFYREAQNLNELIEKNIENREVLIE